MKVGVVSETLNSVFAPTAMLRANCLTAVATRIHSGCQSISTRCCPVPSEPPNTWASPGSRRTSSRGERLSTSTLINRSAETLSVAASIRRPLPVDGRATLELR